MVSSTCVTEPWAEPADCLVAFVHAFEEEPTSQFMRGLAVFTVTVEREGDELCVRVCGVQGQWGRERDVGLGEVETVDTEVDGELIRRTTDPLVFAIDKGFIRYTVHLCLLFSAQGPHAVLDTRDTYELNKESLFRTSGGGGACCK